MLMVVSEKTSSHPPLRKHLALIFKRMPDRREIFKVSNFVVVLVHSWSLLAFLYETPAYLLRLEISDILGILAYVQVFAFLESIIVMIGIILIALLGPRKFILVNFAVRSSIFIFITTIVLSLFRLRMFVIFALNINPSQYVYLYAFIVFFYIFALWDLFAFERKHPKLNVVIQAFIDRLSVLAALLLILDLFWLFVVLYRLLR